MSRLKPCAGSPICPELVRSPDRFCPDHKKAKEAERPSSTERGYDHRWRKEAARYKKHRAGNGTYACDHCGGTEDEVGTLEVDHIDGLGPLGPRGYDWSNFQLLCRPDHQTKTAHQTGAKGAPQ